MAEENKPILRRRKRRTATEGGALVSPMRQCVVLPIGPGVRKISTIGKMKERKPAPCLSASKFSCDNFEAGCGVHFEREKKPLIGKMKE